VVSIWSWAQGYGSQAMWTLVTSSVVAEYSNCEGDGNCHGNNEKKRSQSAPGSARSTATAMVLGLLGRWVCDDVSTSIWQMEQGIQFPTFNTPRRLPLCEGLHFLFPPLPPSFYPLRRVDLCHHRPLVGWQPISPPRSRLSSPLYVRLRTEPSAAVRSCNSN
jgi:hypothetical protein